MKQLIARHRQSFGQFIKFSFVGLLNTGVDVVVFFLLTGIGVPYLTAQVVSYSCGAANSYLLNKVWTFRSSGLSSAEGIRFVIVNLASLGISVVVLRLLHDTAGLDLTVSKAGATVSSLAANFLGNKLWVFRRGGR
jgi:putative flippase GtrA